MDAGEAADAVRATVLAETAAYADQHLVRNVARSQELANALQQLALAREESDRTRATLAELEAERGLEHECMQRVMARGLQRPARPC